VILKLIVKEKHGLEGRTALVFAVAGLSSSKPFAMVHTATNLNMRQPHLISLLTIKTK
jgi:hypothetical protein